MVKHEKSTTNDTLSILTLTPNRSLTWLEAKWIIAVMVSVVMIIAIAWTFVGAWVILPFAGLEVGLFAFLMYKVTRFTYLKQVVTIDSETIRVATGINAISKQQELPRFGTDVFYSETERNWTPPQITFKNAEKRIQIGEFLNDDDMAELRDVIEAIGFPICREHWWKKRQRFLSVNRLDIGDEKTVKLQYRYRPP
jgi:uncharacterized membrane protein